MYLNVGSHAGRVFLTRACLLQTIDKVLFDFVLIQITAAGVVEYICLDLRSHRHTADLRTTQHIAIVHYRRVFDVRNTSCHK